MNRQGYRPIYFLLPESKPEGFLGVFGDSPSTLNHDQRPHYRRKREQQGSSQASRPDDPFHMNPEGFNPKRRGRVEPSR